MNFYKIAFCTICFCCVISSTACAQPKKYIAPVYEEAEVKIEPEVEVKVNENERKVRNVFAKMEKDAIRFYTDSDEFDTITDELLAQAKSDYAVAYKEYKAIAEKSYNPQDAKAAQAQKKIRKAIKIINFAKFKSDVDVNAINFDQFVEDLNKVISLDEKSMKQTGDLSLLYLCDKDRFIEPVDYAPKDIVPLVKNNDYKITKDTLSLRRDVADALTEMAKAARQENVTLTVSSSYRGYKQQTSTFNYWVSVDNLYEAERESARPGTSQHQLGVAIDLGSISNAYASTTEGKWMYKHAGEYGWSLSFPSEEYEDVTGFKWESWHFRYIGAEACKFQKKYFNDIQQYMIEFIDAWRKM